MLVPISFSSELLFYWRDTWALARARRDRRDRRVDIQPTSSLSSYMSWLVVFFIGMFGIFFWS